MTSKGLLLNCGFLSQERRSGLRRFVRLTSEDVQDRLDGRIGGKNSNAKRSYHCYEKR